MYSEVDGILVAAHELKTPLTLLRQLALSLDGLDASSEEIRSEMVEVSERAIRQVNDLAKIRRLEDGIFEMEPVAVNEVCDAVSAEIARLYLNDNLQLTNRYRSRAKLAYANRELLFSVIFNFATSALHYASADASTELSISEQRGKIHIAIRDFGPSLPSKLWQSLRNGFMDHPTAIAMRPGSSSLGLYIASKFSHYMNAEVGAVRHRDGTSFFVNLPISKQASLFQ